MNTTNQISPNSLAIAISLALTTTPSQAIVYTYDNLQRLTGAQYTSGQLLTYQYDPAGNLLNINNRRSAYHLVIGSDDNQVVIRYPPPLFCSAMTSKGFQMS